MATISSLPDASLRRRKSFAKIPEVLEVPSLIRVQLDSYRWLLNEGLKNLFDEVSPIEDMAGKRFELHFEEFDFREPKYSEAECRARDVTYASPLYVKVRLVIKQTGEIKEQDLFMGDLPLMTSQGTFIINGAERVVVSQLVRSPGAYFTRESDPASGRTLCNAKLIPNRGAWLEFETSNKNIIYTKVDRKRKIPVTTLLRCIGYGSSEELIQLFSDIDPEGDQSYILSTIEKDAGITSEEEALVELYRRLRPGEPPTTENAQALLKALFFNPRRYDLGKVGRYKVNKRLGIELMRTAGLSPEEAGKAYPAIVRGAPDRKLLEGLLPRKKVERVHSVLTNRALNREDLVAIVRTVILVNKGEDGVDDIDHLGNRRVKGVGELIQNHFRIGLLRMERVVRERMTLIEPETAVPSGLVNIRPIVAAIKEFFGGSQLSQFMDQTNPLAELTHKRRLSALGPGGLSRERAGFDVRDVHPSHYGRICPIETPEGPNIGLLGSLATYSGINEYGFIETPYRRVVNEVPNEPDALLGKTLREAVKVDGGRPIARAGTTIKDKLLKKLSELPRRMIKVRPFVSDEIVYLAADEEEKYIIAQANSPLDERNRFVSEIIEARFG
ncbi:MAG: DNA-directed RNA polymerase subunit beta, partial [Dehalococcoidia bacterium]